MSAVTPLTPTQRAVLRMIEAAAMAGEQCPSNRAIAERCGLASAGSASNLISDLHKAGWLVVTVTPCRNGRQVTLPASGRATAWPLAGATDHPLPVGHIRLDRDPCFRCGVRADLGCEHQPASVAEEMVA